MNTIIINGSRNVTEKCLIRREGEEKLSKGIIIHAPNDSGLFNCMINNEPSLIKINKYAIDGITLAILK